MDGFDFVPPAPQSALLHTLFRQCLSATIPDPWITRSTPQTSPYKNPVSTSHSCKSPTKCLARGKVMFTNPTISRVGSWTSCKLYGPTSCFSFFFHGHFIICGVVVVSETRHSKAMSIKARHCPLTGCGDPGPISILCRFVVVEAFSTWL